MRTQAEPDEFSPVLDYDCEIPRSGRRTVPKNEEWSRLPLLLLSACSSTVPDILSHGPSHWMALHDVWYNQFQNLELFHFSSHGVVDEGVSLNAVAPPRGTPQSDAKITALEERVRKLEASLAQVLAERELWRGSSDLEPSEEDEVVIQPHQKWIESNRDILRGYSDSFVALDPDEGIVAHAIDGDELEAQLDKLPAPQRSRVVVFHASVYVR